jgi:hypothetical protein
LRVTSCIFTPFSHKLDLLGNPILKTIVTDKNALATGPTAAAAAGGDGGVGSLTKDNVIGGGKMKMALQQTGAARRNSEPTVGFGSLRRVASAANEGMPFRNLIPGKGEDPAMFLTHVPKHESSSREFMILLTS